MALRTIWRVCFVVLASTAHLMLLGGPVIPYRCDLTVPAGWWTIAWIVVVFYFWWVVVFRSGLVPQALFLRKASATAARARSGTLVALWRVAVFLIAAQIFTVGTVFLESWLSSTPGVAVQQDTEIQSGVGPEARPGNTPLMQAIGHGNKAKVERLLASGADVHERDSHGSTALHFAAARGEEDIAALLIANGADLNALDSYGMRPYDDAWHGGMREFLRIHGGMSGIEVIEAASVNDVDALQRLIQRGANVTEHTRGRWTALHMAVLFDHRAAADILMSNGAEINAMDDEGFSPLHVAADYGNTNMARLLVARGADVNLSNELGRTPLHFAAWTGQRETVAFLIASGADVNTRDYAGKTPLDTAEDGSHEDVADFLRHHGGKRGSELE